MAYENVLVKGRWKFNPSWNGFIDYKYPYLVLNCFGGNQANTQFSYYVSDNTSISHLSYTTKDGLYINASNYSSITDIPGFDYNESFNFGDEGQSISYVEYHETFLQIFEPAPTYKLVDATKLDQKFTNITNALRDQKIDHDENHKYSINAIPDVIRELTDVSKDTVTPASMLSGITAHDSNQKAITGSIPTVDRSVTTVEVVADDEQKTLTFTASNNQASGYLASGSDEIASVISTLSISGNTAKMETTIDSTSYNVSADVATTNISTPNISVSKEGVITATVNQTSSGYITEGSSASNVLDIGVDYKFTASIFANAYSAISGYTGNANRYVKQLILPPISTKSKFTIQNSSGGLVRIAYPYDNSKLGDVYQPYTNIRTINPDSSYTFATGETIVAGTPLIVVAAHTIRCSEMTQLVSTALLFSAPSSNTTYTITDG